MSTSQVYDSLTLLQMRKAALLAHWLPGVGVIVRQHGSDLIRVAPHLAHPSQRPFALELNPCAFRQFVMSFADDDGWPSHPLDPTAAIDLSVFAMASTELQVPGIVRAELNAETAVVAFVTAIDKDITEQLVLDQHHARGIPNVSARPVHVDHDPELGATLVHRQYRLGCVLAERAAEDLILELSIVCAAEEVASFVSRA